MLFTLAGANLVLIGYFRRDLYDHVVQWSIDLSSFVRLRPLTSRPLRIDDKKSVGHRSGHRTLCSHNWSTE